MTSFDHLGVPARLHTVLTGLGITKPTPIQAATIPDALAGRDVLGRGRTGSGKTLAFLIPVVARLSGGPRPRPGAPRVLILAPTRELAGQIDAVLRPLAAADGLRSRTVFGGVGQKPQVAALERGVDIVVACPGRLEDLIRQGHCRLDQVEITVLDEADHMADLGFLPAVQRILQQTPADGQRLLFSATLDRAVDALVRRFLPDAATHSTDPAQAPVATMTHHVLQVEREARLPILLDLTSAPGRTIVFTRTKHGAKSLARQLNQGGVPAVELHGNLSQAARTRNLDAFHSGRAATLVATDIAARGIHVDDIALVIHADPPEDHKAYLHRSGRTARAGNSGAVVTLMSGAQTREVRALARAAGIAPATTRVSGPEHPILATLAPGERTMRAPLAIEPPRNPAPRKAAASNKGAAHEAGGGSSRRRRKPSGPTQRTSAGTSRQHTQRAKPSGSGPHPSAGSRRRRRPSARP